MSLRERGESAPLMLIGFAIVSKSGGEIRPHSRSRFSCIFTNSHVNRVSLLPRRMPDDRRFTVDMKTCIFIDLSVQRPANNRTHRKLRSRPAGMAPRETIWARRRLDPEFGSSSRFLRIRNCSRSARPG